MKDINGILQAEREFTQPVITIGSFDGFHLGHQKLIAKTIEVANDVKGESVILTFDPHPLEVLGAAKSLFKLFNLEDQKRQAQKLGVNGFVVEKFSLEFAKTSAKDFLENWLQKYIRPRGIVVGYDFSFGSDKEQSAVELKAFCEENNIVLEIVDPYKLCDEIVSSSLIREKIFNGEMERAKELLGRDYYIEGVVEHGDGRGQKLGIPTANIFIATELYPKNGVYATVLEIEGRFYPAVSNIGTRPTFTSSSKAKSTQVFLETHMLNSTENLYGKEIKVLFKKFLREEKRFSGREALKEQLIEDKKTAEKVLDEMGCIRD